MKKGYLTFLVIVSLCLLLVGCGFAGSTDDGTDIDTNTEPPKETVCTEHIWYDTPTIYPPDCTSQGEIIYYCQVCYESKVEYIPAKGHTHSDEWTYDNTHHYHDSTCGCILEWKDLGEHTWSQEGVVTRETTCAEPGIITYTCTVCPATREGLIERLPHTYADEYTEYGIYHYREGICGCVGIKGDIEYHEWDEGTVITPATCKENGVALYKCLLCTGTKEEVLYKTNDHSYESVVYPPTCTKEGYTQYTCTVCERTYKGTITQKIDHTYEGKTVAPTCQNKGYDIYTCTECGKYYKKNVVDIIDHIYSSVVYPPTCSSSGYTFHGCKMCDDYYRDSYVSPLPHTYSSVTKEPSCTQKGYTTYTCTECGYTYKDDYTDLLPHEYEKTSYTEPTCTVADSTVYTCKHCGTFYTLGGSTLPHPYKEEIIPPTCIKSGYTLYTCTECGSSYKDKYTDLIPHNYVDIICTVCGKNEYSIGLLYTLSEDKSYYIVSGMGTCKDTELVIPNVHKGLPVYEIEPSAFENNTDIVSVLFLPGDNGQSIGSRAFAGCSSLNKITFNNVEKIGSYAFSSTAITSLDTGDNIESIGLCAFERCASLTSAELGKGIYTLYAGIFAYCDALDRITVDSANTYYYVVSGCLIEKSSATIFAATNSFVIPTDKSVVDSIGSYTFSGQKELTEITIPENVTFIGMYAFHECENLTSLTFALTDTWYRTENMYEAYEKTGGTTFPDGTGKWNAQFLSLYEYEYYWYRK